MNKILLTILVIGTCAFASFAQTTGDLDSSFGISGNYRNGFGSAYDEPFAIAMQSDGKMVAVGGAVQSSQNDFIVVRFNADGTLDSTFSQDGYVITDVTGSVDVAYAVAIQPDGKIVVVGSTSSQGFSFARYNSDGTLDPTFSSDGITTVTIGTSGAEAYGVAIQTDGKIVATGGINAGGHYDFGLMRLNSNGSVDTAFGTSGKVTTAFGTANDVPNVIGLQPDGKIVVGGRAEMPNPDFALARYNTNGTLDTTFDGDGKVTTPVSTTFLDSISDFEILSDGKILAVGQANGTGVVRYNANGSLDTSFDGDGKIIHATGGTPYSMSLLGDGRIVLAGIGSTSGNANFSVSRLNANGSADTTFDADGFAQVDFGAVDRASGIVTQADGKYFVVGRTAANSNQPTYSFAAARLNGDGSLDTTFDSDGKWTRDLGNHGSTIRSIAIQHDAMIVALGNSGGSSGNDLGLARFNYYGTLDTTFGNDGRLVRSFANSDEQYSSVALQTDGKIVVAGFAQVSSVTEFALARFNSNGTPDTTFDTDGFVTTSVGTFRSEGVAVAIQTDGKIVVGGRYNTASSGQISDFAVVRFNTNGTLDTTFGVGGKATATVAGSNEFAYAMTLQADGKIVLAGESGFSTAIVRFNANGSIDTTFDTDGIVITSCVGTTGQGRINSIAIQSDGKLVAVGRCYMGSTLGQDWLVMRYNVDGSLDTTFDTDGRVQTDFDTDDDTANSVKILSDGRIVVAGEVRVLSSNDYGIARYTSNGVLDTTFDNSKSAYRSFGVDGKSNFDFGNSSDSAFALAVDSRGDYVIAGQSFPGFGIARVLGSPPATAAEVSVAGRVVTFDGQGLRNAIVRLTNDEGEISETRTSSFGYFKFESVQSGRTYVLSVRSKRFSFATTIINVNDEITDWLVMPQKE